MEIQLLASQLGRSGEHLLRRLDARAAAALATGGGRSLNPKVWPCEDSLAVACLADGAYLAAVADAHWGGSAGQVVARQALGAWERSSEEPPGRLRAVLGAIEAAMRAGADPRDPSETTVLLVHLSGRTLEFVSVGDSMLLLIDPARRACWLLNPLTGYFLGPNPASYPPGAPQSGRVQLEPGTVVLLASDGLEAVASGMEPDDIAAEMIGDAPLEARVAALLARAGDPERGGGRDNLALVALEVA